jgi:hypothetical protein
MYANHQPQLSRLGRSSPEGLTRVATFALCTIRQPLRIACADYKMVRQGDTSSLFGSKHAGLAYLHQHAPELWERCEYAYETSDDDTAADLILPILASVPCLGPAKTGFVAQMVYGLSGCIDTHNLTRFSLPDRVFRGREARHSWPRVRATIRDYNAFCRKVGGTEALWDGWCTYLAERDPVNYPNAFRVSELHLAPLEI